MSSGTVRWGESTSAISARRGLENPAFSLFVGIGPLLGIVVALPGLDGMNDAMVLFQEDASAIGMVHQSQTRSVEVQLGEAGDKLALVQTQVSGDPGNIDIREPDLARPSAAGAALSTLVNGNCRSICEHTGKVIRKRFAGKA
jgi:hypothetical protein